jgi:hypothetical protein
MTTNQINSKQFIVNIDFDEASAEWHKNKKSIGNSQYKYICTVITNKNTKINNNKNTTTTCQRVCYKNSNKCWIHRNAIEM